MLPDGALAPRTRPLAEFLRAIPYLMGVYIPPRPVLNDLLRRGQRDAGMSGGALWEPFEIDCTEYNELVRALQDRGTRRGRFGWGPFEPVSPPGSVQTYEQWSGWRNEHIRAGRQADLTTLASGLSRADDELAAVPPDDHERLAASQDDVWEAQQAIAEHLVTHWRQWVSGRDTVNEFVDLMTRAGQAWKTTWYAERLPDMNEAWLRRQEFADLQRRVSAFLAEHPPPQ